MYFTFFVLSCMNIYKQTTTKLHQSTSFKNVGVFRFIIASWYFLMGVYDGVLDVRKRSEHHS